MVEQVQDVHGVSHSSSTFYVIGEEKEKLVEEYTGFGSVLKKFLYQIMRDGIQSEGVPNTMIYDFLVTHCLELDLTTLEADIEYATGQRFPWNYQVRVGDQLDYENDTYLVSSFYSNEDVRDKQDYLRLVLISLTTGRAIGEVVLPSKFTNDEHGIVVPFSEFFTDKKHCTGFVLK